MEETEVLSNQRKWKPSIDKSYHNTKNRPELRLAAATTSRSDPHSSLRSNRNHSYYSPNKESLPPSFGFGNSNNPSGINTNQKSVGYFFNLEGSRSSSFTEGFSQPEDDEDEATDILVWNAPKGPSQSNRLQQCHKSLSDSSEFQLPSSSLSVTQKSSLIQKSKAKGSRISRLQIVNPLDTSRSDENTSEYETQLFAVTKQLEMIKTTQDNILSELSSDISTLQYENVHLKNQNEHLTVQNSHLLQVINDLSNEVEIMRQVFRTRGWPLHQDDPGNETDELEQKTCSPSQQMRIRRNQRFENVPLEDLSQDIPDVVEAFIAGPGDDQVSALSNRHKEHSLRKKKSRSKSKPEKTKRGCLRGLFKRKDKRNHSSCDEEQTRLS